MQTPGTNVVRNKPPAAGKGRPKGSANKSTTDVRKAVALLAERNVGKLEQWLEATAAGDVENGVKPDPGKAAALLLAAMEYHIPKLARTEHTGEDGGPIKFAKVERTIVDPKS